MKYNNKKILVIDDESEIREMISDLMEMKGYKTVTAADGKEGIELFNEKDPDVVLVDLQMPTVDGLAVLKYIQETNPEKPVIVISGTGVLQDVINAMRLGAWDYLEKPLQSIEMIEYAVKRALEKSALIEDNKLYQESLEEKIEERTKELHDRTVELVEANIQLKSEIEERKKAEEEVRKINEQLEQRVWERTAELKAMVDKLEEDEEAGRKIQTKLLPETPKKIGVYEFSNIFIPSMYLSGDFIDYFRINSSYIGFYAADVSGHGASSAFITVFLKTFMMQMMKSFKNDKSTIIYNPARVLRELNKQLLKENLEKHLTLFYGVIDRNKNKLRFSNGGQYPFPIITDKKKKQFLKYKGTPLGMFDFTKYKNHTLKLPEKFSLLIVSDGVLDILPEKKLTDKEQRLLDSIDSADSKLDHIVEKLKIDQYKNLPDDVTIMMIRRP